MIKIAPSILAADFGRLAEAVQMIERCGADMVHMDVMDGNFVPEITFGAQMVKALKRYTSLPLDVHLMIKNPQKHVDSFLEAGADNITIHFEACKDAAELLQYIRQGGISASVSIKPKTKPERISDILGLADMVLVMTVEPGYGGQQYIPRMTEKIRELKSIIDRGGYRTMIEVDGGIDGQTVGQAVSAGATCIVAGTYIFQSGDPRKAIESLRCGRT